MEKTSDKQAKLVQLAIMEDFPCMNGSACMNGPDEPADAERGDCARKEEADRLAVAQAAWNAEWGDRLSRYVMSPVANRAPQPDANHAPKRDAEAYARDVAAALLVAWAIFTLLLLFRALRWI